MYYSNFGSYLKTNKHVNKEKPQIMIRNNGWFNLSKNNTVVES